MGVRGGGGGSQKVTGIFLVLYLCAFTTHLQGDRPNAPFAEWFQNTFEAVGFLLDA